MPANIGAERITCAKGKNKTKQKTKDLPSRKTRINKGENNCNFQQFASIQNPCSSIS